MCGLAGVLGREPGRTEEELSDLVGAMAARVAHRGPDDAGVWADAEAGLALGHRRLAVVDLSPAGRQPMTSADGRWVIAYNGEVYNWPALRAALESSGTRLRGHCDTEVLVEAVSLWGVEGALRRCDGMFAFALWDRQERTLHLARDRLGEKPLYFGRAARDLVFGSELSALRAHPGLATEVDRDALAVYLRLGYIPAPLTIYRGVRKLTPGTILSVRAGGDIRDPHHWWSLDDALAAAVARRRPMAPDDAVAQTEALLADAVAERMVADVPLGAFLSGGVDSSAVVALMVARGAAVRTFTVGFPGHPGDESGPAAAVARHLGTQHTELTVTASEALDMVPRLARVYDEPFGDPSAVPTALMCAAARSEVTVALSGDGGDEVFGGYNRYSAGRAAWRWSARVPRPVRRAAAALAQEVPPAAWDRVAAAAGRMLPAARVPAAGDKVHKLGRLLNADSLEGVYRSLVSGWEDPDQVVEGGHECLPAGWALSIVDGLEDPAERMMAWDSATTLPDEMLAKVDRASMAVGLEVRVPLVDHAVVEAAWGVPAEVRLPTGRPKWLLRQVLCRHLPPALVDRPKTGFDPPLADWLRGPLRDWAEELLGERRLAAEGYLRPEPVRRRWEEHLSGRRNWEYPLWSVLMFQAWRAGD